MHYIELALAAFLFSSFIERQQNSTSHSAFLRVLHVVECPQTAVSLQLASVVNTRGHQISVVYVIVTYVYNYLIPTAIL